jgi:hypothetical protein
MLIAGPGVVICERCVAQATRLAAGSVVKGWAEGLLLLEASGSEASCGFCGRQVRQVGFLVASGLAGAPGGKPGQGARICDECLDLCGEILAEPTSS